MEQAPESTIKSTKVENVVSEAVLVIKPNTDFPPDRSLIKPYPKPVNIAKPTNNVVDYSNVNDMPKSKYKAEKAMKNLKKSMAYKDSYKEKEQMVKYNNRPFNNDISSEKLDLCDDIILILKDKIKNNQIQITSFEQKTVNKFFAKFEKREVVNQPQQVIKQACFTGDNCIVWYCKFEHSELRKKECKCAEDNCDKLHSHQALCKNQNHPDDCKLAHRLQDLK